MAFSSWAKQSHGPMEEMMEAHLERYGIPRVPPPPEPWMVCEESEDLLIVLEKGGFRDKQVVPQPAGHFIQPEDWWTFLWGAAPRGRMSRLPPESLERFRKEILEEVRGLQGERGIWFDVSALIGIGLRDRE